MANTRNWKLKSLPCFPLSFVVSMFTFTLVGCSPSQITVAVKFFLSHCKQGGMNKPFVYDLCIASTLGALGISSWHFYLSNLMELPLSVST